VHRIEIGSRAKINKADFGSPLDPCYHRNSRQFAYRYCTAQSRQYLRLLWGCMIAPAPVLIGEKTKNLLKFVRWELDLALELVLPIIAVNLNEKRFRDPDRCPPIIRDECVAHIPFKMKAIKLALDNWPGEFKKMPAVARAQGARFYNDDQYKKLGV
jgi:hypothetical protein